MSDHFKVRPCSVSKYFVENLCICAQEGHWPVAVSLLVCFVAVSLPRSHDRAVLAGFITTAGSTSWVQNKSFPAHGQQSYFFFFFEGAL